MTQVLVENLEQIKERYKGKTISELEAIIAKLNLTADYLKEKGRISEYLPINQEIMNIQSLIDKMREESKQPLIKDDEELDLGPNIASVGDTVTLLGIYGEEMYTLVKTPGNPIMGYLNINTPVGAAILGKKRGQTVIAQTPNGLYTAIIDEINKAKVKKMSGSN